MSYIGFIKTQHEYNELKKISSGKNDLLENNEKHYKSR